MRLIGTLRGESDARIFSDYLYAQRITNKIESGDNEVWNIWVHEEDRLETAKSLLDEYRTNPTAAKFQGASEIARQQREREKQEYGAYKKRVFNRHKIFPKGDRIGVLTGILIGISVVVALISGLGRNMSVLNYLLITKYNVIGSYIQWYKGFPEIQHGQFWRLFTPIFIHFGIIHLLFNMLWLRDLGSMIERRQSPWMLATLVFVIAAISNLGQYFASGPGFGGMSGVVYGLLGYIWIRGKYDPNSGLFVHHQIVIMLVIWFFVCLFGLIGNVANTAHGVGFGVGIAWGFISAQFARRKYFRRKK